MVTKLVKWRVNNFQSRAAHAVTTARARVGETPLYAVVPETGGAKMNCESFIRDCFDGINTSAQAQRFEAIGWNGWLGHPLGGITRASGC